MKSSSILTSFAKYQKQNKPEQPRVVFSARAYSSILSEVLDKVRTETGGVFLGYCEDGIWQVVESIDPGPRSCFEIAYFEYDQDYVNHLINKISRIYERQLDLIGLWHRHPGSLDRFSATDDGTNEQYAALSSHGAISALVNIDPRFRLTVYQVNNDPLRYRQIPYRVLEREEDSKQASYVDAGKRIGQIERLTSSSSSTSNQTKQIARMSVDDVKATLKNFLAKREMQGMVNENVGTIQDWTDEDYVLILTAIEDDSKKLEEIGVGLTMSANECGQMSLIARDAFGDTSTLIEGFKPREDGKILFSIDGQTYFYSPRIIISALEEASS